MLVRDILHNKGNQVYTVAPNETVYQAISKMDELDIGALVVVENQELVGIISERDYRSKVILKGRSSKSTQVREIMVKDVIRVTTSESVERCMAIMTEHKIRHLPVMEGDNIVGVISIGDLVKSIISKQKIEIKNMREYIQGEAKYPG